MLIKIILQKSPYTSDNDSIGFIVVLVGYMLNLKKSKYFSVRFNVLILVADFEVHSPFVDISLN